MCPLLQNVDFDVLFMYHQVKSCVSFSFNGFLAVLLLMTEILFREKPLWRQRFPGKALSYFIAVV